MIARSWKGPGDYDVLLTLSEQEMRKLAGYYKVKWSFFTTDPSKSFDDEYFCFACFSRKALALLPFLSLAFGGMYDELPIGDDPYECRIDYAEYALEKFSFDSGESPAGHAASSMKTAVKGDGATTAYRWLVRDGYQYLLCCTKGDAFEIISRFGRAAKSPTLRADDGVKYSYYLINVRDKVITPIRYLSWVSGGHGDQEAPRIGEKCSVALFLDNYCFKEYPFHR